MEAILQNYYKRLYSCPILSLTNYVSSQGLEGRLFAYLNFDGPTGTGKDALAEGMLALARARGDLKPGQAVAEAGSGAFGCALAIAAARSGHPVYLTVPASLSAERKAHLESLGAKLVFSSAQDHKQLCSAAARVAQENGAYYTDYFNNDDNPEFHRRVTGPAILNRCKELNAIIAGVGSGGTLTGVGEYARAWNSELRVIGVEPYESRVLSGGMPGRHSIAGIGVGYIPDNYNPYVVDKIADIPSVDAINAARKVLLTDGVPAAPAGGACLCAAEQFLRERPGQSVLCIFNGRISAG